MAPPGGAGSAASVPQDRRARLMAELAQYLPEIDHIQVEADEIVARAVDRGNFWRQRAHDRAQSVLDATAATGQRVRAEIAERSLADIRADAENRAGAAAQAAATVRAHAEAHSNDIAQQLTGIVINGLLNKDPAS